MIPSSYFGIYFCIIIICLLFKSRATFKDPNVDLAGSIVAFSKEVSPIVYFLELLVVIPISLLFTIAAKV